MRLIIYSKLPRLWKLIIPFYIYIYNIRSDFTLRKSNKIDECNFLRVAFRLYVLFLFFIYVEVILVHSHSLIVNVPELVVVAADVVGGFVEDNLAGT